MERDPIKVAQELYRRVLAGYLPRYDFESCIDHWCDWLVLSEEEFNRIKERALADRDKLLHKKAFEKKLDEAKAAFWDVLKWSIPIFVAIGLVYFGWVLLHLIVLPERNQRDIVHLQREIGRLSSEIEIIQQKQHDIVQKVMIMETNIAYFTRGNEELNKKLNEVDKRLQQVQNIIRPAENLQSHVENLAKEIIRLDGQIKNLPQKINNYPGGR